MKKATSKIRVGLVGVGNWAIYAHIPVLNLLSEFEVVAISSRRQGYADEIAKQFGIPYALNTFEAVAEHPEVDLVAILTPAPQHETGVRAAIAAGKDVYCEWPLTPSTESSISLLQAVNEAGVCHLIGLQRRLVPSNRYLHDLLKEGYVGKVRSVRLHVSENLFQQQRSAAIGFTVDAANFSHPFSIYGGHFLDMLFAAVGDPRDFNALIANQFESIMLIETGETIPTTAPDQVLLSGTIQNGAVFSVHIEGGKRNNFGVQLDITGTEGDLKLSNTASFHNLEDNKVEGARGERQPLQPLPVPSKYNWLPPSDIPASALELANIYAAYARDIEEGTHIAPTFSDAVRLHRLLETIANASESGERRIWNLDLGGNTTLPE